MRVGGARPPPFQPITITYKDVVYALAERSDILYSPYFISTLYVLSALDSLSKLDDLTYILDDLCAKSMFLTSLLVHMAVSVPCQYLMTLLMHMTTSVA
jgi:hypothetical protein